MKVSRHQNFRSESTRPDLSKSCSASNAHLRFHTASVGSRLALDLTCKAPCGTQLTKGSQDAKDYRHSQRPDNGCFQFLIRGANDFEAALSALRVRARPDPSTQTDGAVNDQSGGGVAARARGHLGDPTRGLPIPRTGYKKRSIASPRRRTGGRDRCGGAPSSNAHRLSSGSAGSSHSRSGRWFLARQKPLPANRLQASLHRRH
jgi:hypothetical protein